MWHTGMFLIKKTSWACSLLKKNSWILIYVILALGEHGAKQFLSTWGLTKFKLFARVAVLVKSRLIIAREVYIQYQVQAVLCDKILKSGP